MIFKTIFKTALITAIIIFPAACKKNGTGGKSTVQGKVKHHGLTIPGAMVYIKYDATDFPGADISVYDASVQASSSTGQYEFTDLLPGNYYIYGVGYDSTISEAVFGGTALKIKYSERKETLELNVPVVE
jgi:hypothetical protein